jgi:hypothetical protein
MKRFFLPAIIVMLITACNNANKKHDGHPGTGKAPKTLTDSLLKDIDEGHILGMSKIGKLHNTKKAVLRVIDSIGTLPAKAQQTFAPYVAQLNEVIKDLDYADFAMDKWMTEYTEDSAAGDAGKHNKYLAEEKIKVDKMKEAILSSIQKADSLLKVKF